ncbi:hypothetical protein ACFQ07_25040, partial [Actinomadura adrarensis]
AGGDPVPIESPMDRAEAQLGESERMVEELTELTDRARRVSPPERQAVLEILRSLTRERGSRS